MEKLENVHIDLHLKSSQIQRMNLFVKEHLIKEGQKFGGFENLGNQTLKFELKLIEVELSEEQL